MGLSWTRKFILINGNPLIIAIYRDIVNLEKGKSKIYWPTLNN